MDELKKIDRDELTEIAGKLGFNYMLVLKDYYITLILYLIKDVEYTYFKGGTALQKIFLDYSRLSEDIDFTIAADVKEVKSKIKSILENSKLFGGITKEKDVKGFTRLVVSYNGPSDESGKVFIDLNERSKLITKPEKHKIKHFYKGHIPEFSLNTLSREEMVAEKVVAAIARNQPRDCYDLYKIIKQKMPINMPLAKEKCAQSGVQFDIIRMFNKANKLKSRWDQDLLPLLSKEASFKEVITTLAYHFNLKEEKNKKYK